MSMKKTFEKSKNEANNESKSPAVYSVKCSKSYNTWSWRKCNSIKKYMITRYLCIQTNEDLFWVFTKVVEQTLQNENEQYQLHWSINEWILLKLLKQPSIPLEFDILPNDHSFSLYTIVFLGFTSISFERVNFYCTSVWYKYYYLLGL